MPAPAHPRLFIGLMSGTSVDGVDAVLVEADGPGLATLASASVQFPAPLLQAIQSLQQPGAGELELAASVSLQLADWYAEATRLVLDAARREPSEITALGAHGQTVRHRPGAGFTIQLLNAARLAELTGIAVVHDFRSADVAAGGQGAPLVPAFHAHVFGCGAHARAIVNIGGIANISLLPPSGSSGSPPVLGHDTGPGNTLLDQWHKHHRGGGFDRDGDWAARGTVDSLLLETMLTDPYFNAPPPKSTGRDHFNLDWVERHLRHRHREATYRRESGPGGHPDGEHEHRRARQPTSAPTPRDVQATLAELSALTIARSCDPAREVYLCGGGAFNRDLVRRIAARLPEHTIADTSALGIAPMAVEAAAFAWLAARRIDGLPGNLPAVTGASRERLLGSITDPSGRLTGRR